MANGGIIGVAIKRPVSVSVGVILVVLFGVLAVFDIPIQLTPDIARPVLTVRTVWPGAAPSEVESEILEPQEDMLKTLAGLVRMSSNATLGQGDITLELEVGTVLEQALVRASNLLAQVRSYPDNVEQPVISTAGSSGPPIVVAIIQSTGSKAVGSSRSWIEEMVLPRFQRIKGIADVFLRGGQDTEVDIQFDPGALAARGLNLGHIAAIVRGELRDLSGGDITMGKRRYLVRTPVAPATPEDFEHIVVATGRDGTPIRLGDVAQVRLGLGKPTGTVYANGKDSLALLFFREAGTNVLEVTEHVRTVAQQVQEDLLDGQGLRLDVVSDQTGYIYGALGLVRQNLLLGGFLAVLVLLVFLRSVSAALVVSIAIPVCVIATALGMSMLGRTINVVSLAGMAFAVGMVVDNALVVLENIDTWRLTNPKDVRRAALQGTKEVWGAILASTLTTAAVFLPIIGWQDEVGELLRDIAVAISIAVMASLVVSVLVIPSFAAKFLGTRTADQLPMARLAEMGARFRSNVGRMVHPLVQSSFKGGVVVVLALLAAVSLGVGLLPPMEYLPTGNRNLVFGVVVPPPGYSIEEMDAIGRSIQQRVVRHLGVDVDGVPSVDRAFFVGDPQSAFMGAVASDEKRIGELSGFLRGVAGSIPGVFGVASQASLFGRGFGGGRTIDIEIQGSRLEQVVPLAARMFGMVREAIPGSQIRPTPSLELGAPELRVLPHRAMLSSVGLNGTDLGLIVSAMVDGAIIGEYSREGEPKIDVVLRAKGGGIRDPAALFAAPISTGQAQLMPLGVLADIQESLGPTQLQRIERIRAVSLQVTPPDEVALEDAIAKIRRDVIGQLRQQGAIDAGIHISLAGTAGDLEIASKRFAKVLLLALLISFLLLAALFEDFIAPLAVLVTVPLAGAGGVLGLRWVDATLGTQPLDLMTALGFIILIGVVVNNAILVVDGAIARLRDGAPLAKAVPYAVERRVRPIFMSTLTSLAGLTPLVLFPGSGSELYRGIGAIVLGGLAISTVLTLFVVPSVFALLWRLRGIANSRKASARSV